MMTHVLPFLFVFVSFILAQDAGSLFDIKFHASAPRTYDHLVGGGAYNDATIGRSNDIVNSLEGGDFKCNDLVSHLVVVTVSPASTGAQCITVSSFFTADSTGQPGVAYEELPFDQANNNASAHLRINRGSLNENGAGVPCTTNPGKGFYGRDCGHKSNNDDETVTLVKQTLLNPYFSGNSADLIVKYRICGLDANEVIVVRVDIRIICLPNSSPTGNLQAGMLSGDGVTFSDHPDAGVAKITGVGNTIPFQGLNQVIGVSTCIVEGVNITGPNFNSTVSITSPDMTNGGSVRYNFWYSWDLGKYKLQNALDTNAVSVSNFDILCSFMHDGTTLFSASGCGCEATFIPVTQPQIFFNVNSDYYFPTPTAQTLVINGVSVQTNRYTRKSAENAILFLNVLSTNNNVPVRAEFENGEIWTFTNVVSGTQYNSYFNLPPSSAACTCGRPTDIEIIMQRDANIPTCTDFGYLVGFAKSFVDGFQVDVNNSNMGVFYYDASSVKRLALNNGNSNQAVKNALGGIPCVASSNKAPGTSTTGNLVAAIDAAIADLAANSRGYPKAIVTFGNGYFQPDADVRAAVARAVAANIKVFAFIVQPKVIKSYLINMVSHEDNLVIRQTPTYAALAGMDMTDVSARLCLVNTRPCGEFCCGNCDTVCGACTAVTSCPTTTNCSQSIVIINNCCQPVNSPSCPAPPSNQCLVASCNPSTGLCSNTNTCGLGAVDTACYSYSCATGTCIKTARFSSSNCTIRTCSTTAPFVIVSTPVVCAAHGSAPCYFNQCVESSGGCVSQLNDTTGTVGDLCFNTTCTGSGWTAVPRDCSNGDPCNPGTCLSGVCTNTPILCGDPSNACDTSVCNATTGSYTLPNCTGTSITCSPTNPNGDLCSVLKGKCDSVTGSCTYVNKVCANISSCPGNTRVCVGGNCVCENTAAPTAPLSFDCPAPCEQNECFTSVCDYDTTPSSPTCTTAIPTDCSALVTGSCDYLLPCDNSTGCDLQTYDDTYCATQLAPTLGLCEVAYADQNAPGCCVARQKLCSATDNCISYSCNPATGECDPTNTCPQSSDLCELADCVGNTCTNTSTVCPVIGACETGSCNSSSGLCVYSATVCDDGDLCTVDSCDEVTGLCTTTDVVCDGSSLNACQESTGCDSATGGCTSQEIVCDDGLECTVDSCDTTTGCVYTPFTSLCAADVNPCVVSSSCDPATSTLASGCVTTRAVCPDENANFYCSTESCVDFTGCVETFRDCSENLTNSSCNTYNCSEDARACELVQADCFNYFGIVAGIIVAGVVVGAVAAALLLAGVMVGGTAAAVSQTHNHNQESKIHQNPIFKAQTTSGQVL